MADKRAGHVLYVSHYLDERVVRERGLPSLSAASSNRVRRIAEAVKSAGMRIVVISPAAAMSMSWKGRLFHAWKVARAGRVPVVFCKCLGLRYLGICFQPFSVLGALCSIARQRDCPYVWIYNYRPDMVLVAFVARFIFRARVIFQIEDVCTPRLQDWTGRGDERPLYQVIGWVCMKILVFWSDGIIVPTRRFTAFIHGNKPLMVISGCIRAETELQEKPGKKRLSVLFSGVIDREQGISAFLETIDKVNSAQECADEVDFHLCGFVESNPGVVREIQSAVATHQNFHFHGEVSSERYRALLRDADICVALQLAKGRHSSTKVPSKAYEYLANGKCVIASDMGDLGDLPEEIITICDGTGDSVAEAIKKMVLDKKTCINQGKMAWRYAKDHFGYEAVGNRIIDFIMQFSKSG